MKTLKDFFNTQMINWLQDNSLKYNIANINLNKGDLIILHNDKFCLKIYDRLGHGYGVTVNVADKYDEGIYENDIFSLARAFEFLKINETALFTDRTENQYEQNLPKLITDIKTIIPRLNQMTSSQWNDMKEWINKEAMKQFS